MNHKVQIIDETDRPTKTMDADDGTLLHDLLVHESGYHAPCGGNGTCSKCKIALKENAVYTDEERLMLTEHEIKQNVHLACRFKVTQDLTVKLKESRYQIAEDAYQAAEPIDPLIKRTHFDVRHLRENPSMDYSSTLKKMVGLNKISLEGIKKIPQLMISGHQTFVVVHDNEAILDITDALEEGYGIAIDIGTTTIVSYLYSLSSGGFIDVVSGINRQKNFGFDVIARIQYAHEAKGLEELHQTVIHQLNEMIEELLKKNNINEKQLDELVIAGNTVMMHLLVGANPKDIGAAPFTPVFTEVVFIETSQLGLKGAKHCKALLLPSIAAYVGADIVSGMLAADMNRDGCSLLVDLGTNGEIALLNSQQIMCCATAAGPAFEGANISCGVGGMFGAIKKIFYENGELCYTTINDEAPVGLCGSGLIDGIAYMLDKGYIDETGYLEGDDLSEVEDMAALLIAEKEDGTKIYITQKDIREVQLAKGAIRAGIETMMAESGITKEAIDKVYIAGGFGSYMDKESAIKIGLLPKNLEEKLISIGNSAGIGAIKVLLNQRSLAQIDEIKSKCHYVELSNSAKFMDCYMESMSF